MKIDWNKHKGVFSIKEIETDNVIAEAKQIELRVHSVLVQTDGNRHAYLVCKGQIERSPDSDDLILITRSKTI